MKILVTGGAGYIGTELVKQLQHNNKVEQIIIYDNLVRKNYSLFISGNLDVRKISFVNGDVLDTRKLKAAMQGTDVAVHLAARVSTPFASEDPHSFEQVNHWGTAEVCYAAEESNVKRFIYMSSTSVYGAGNEAHTITSATDAKTFYGTSKLRGEQHVQRLSQKMDVLVLRCGNVYGFSPSMRFDAVINRFMFEANYYNRISIQGNGNQFRAFVPVQKVVSALQSALQTIPAGTYNLVEKNLTVLQLAYTIKEICPGLEFLFINQHLSVRNLMVEQDENLDAHLNYSTIPLAEELQNFSNHFSFHPHVAEQKSGNAQIHT